MIMPLIVPSIVTRTMGYSLFAKTIAHFYNQGFLVVENKIKCNRLQQIARNLCQTLFVQNSLPLWLYERASHWSRWLLREV